MSRLIVYFHDVDDFVGRSLLPVCRRFNKSPTSYGKTEKRAQRINY